MISNDNTRVICLFINREQQQQNFIIVTYELHNPKKPKQKIQIYGDYLLADEFVQDKSGKVYCLPYFDTGYYKIHLFDQNNDKILRMEKINEMLNIGTDVDPEQGFTTPAIHVIFMNTNIILVNVYDQFKMINYHFQYDFCKQEVIGEPISTNLKQNLLNYPLNCFFNRKTDEIYVVYRHGQFITFNNSKGQKDEFGKVLKDKLLSKSGLGGLLMKNNLLGGAKDKIGGNFLMGPKNTQ